RDGVIVTMRFVKGISIKELEEKVQTLLYTNAPVKDAVQVKRIIDAYGLKYDINLVANNELRVALYRPGVDIFTDGDDAVRYLCWAATGEPLLIKSKEVIAAVAGNNKFFSTFFETHALPLAQVFNRHKRLILAAKNKNTAGAINRISRLSKTRHVPLHESLAKTFVHRALIGEKGLALDSVATRDLFKYLNLLAQKRVQSKTAAYRVRNGKVFIRADRPVYELADIDKVERAVLTHLHSRLAPLHGQNILLDGSVDYGLPISRKQTLGRLPFGTRVTSGGNEITSGMYWENAWGARDLDLSAISLDGQRVGWGGRSGYHDREIIFSGDIVDAYAGAMEFMTSRAKDYGLMVNIFAGENGSEMELVVGSNRTKSQWIDQPIIREKHKLDSRNSVIGFVKGKTFVAYTGRLNQSRVSGETPILNEMRADLWTVQRLFNHLGINFDVDKRDEEEYDYDLTYGGFSLDKLEDLFKTA
ncbi:MAG: hypothetical protein KAJ19_25865, partial [Gammaproteobacteria bacterium]|nr:hypothetical protein [Gammaproteobacteria bacterium]